MPLITELQVHYRLKDDSGEVIAFPPAHQETVAIKLEIGRVVHELRQRGDVQYYYVVVKVRKSDGTAGFRTIIPKTLI